MISTNSSPFVQSNGHRLWSVVTELLTIEVIVVSNQLSIVHNWIFVLITVSQCSGSLSCSIS